MLFPVFLLLSSGLVAAGGPVERRAVVSIPSVVKKPSTPLFPAANTLTLNRRKSPKGYNARSAGYQLHRKPSSRGGPSRGGSSGGGVDPSKHTTGLLSLEIGEEFAANITFGNQTFLSIIDTGSSDTWVAETGFQCVDLYKGPLPEDNCAFGPPFTPGSSFTKIADENFNITYGDGEFATGDVGYEDVTLAGIKVRQEVALVNYAAWEGDGTTSGLTGLAYPAL
jgi:hypothetical protein